MNPFFVYGNNNVIKKYDGKLKHVIKKYPYTMEEGCNNGTIMGVTLEHVSF